MSFKEEVVKNFSTAEKFIKHLNEKSDDELRAIEIIDRTSVIMEVAKNIQKK